MSGLNVLNIYQVGNPSAYPEILLQNPCSFTNIIKITHILYYLTSNNMIWIFFHLLVSNLPVNNEGDFGFRHFIHRFSRLVKIDLLHSHKYMQALMQALAYKYIFSCSFTISQMGFECVYIYRCTCQTHTCKYVYVHTHTSVYK